MPPFEITIYGDIPSKKNNYRPRKGGGGKGLYRDTALKSKIDHLSIQIPGEFRDLKLVHPDVTYQFYLPPNTKHNRPWSRDLDGAVTTILDVLVSMGVFKDDKASVHNGHKHIPPAVLLPDGEPERVEITVTPNGRF